MALALLVFSLFVIGGLYKAMFAQARGAVEQLYDARFELLQAKQRATASRA
jgi:cbb3-type cytochrome oxidase subunit 3